MFAKPTFVLTIFFTTCFASVLAQAQESCVLTPTTCQCASSTPSGTCLRSQGDGSCLLGLCSEGYRCDCFGYELCNVSKCGKHVTVGNAIPSETVPFQCEYAAGAGQCTNAVDFLDTVGAANNAESDAVTSNDETTADELDTTLEVEEIQHEKKAVNEVLKELEREADDIADKELDNIDAEAEIVEDAVEEAAVLAVEAARDAQKASKAQREARKLRRVARRADRVGKNKKVELEKEEKKPVRNKVVCDRLKAEIEEVTREKKRAAKGCGEKAKESRNFKKGCQQKKVQVEKIKEKAKAAGNRCMQKSQNILGKAKGRFRQ